MIVKLCVNDITYYHDNVDSLVILPNTSDEFLACFGEDEGMLDMPTSICTLNIGSGREEYYLYGDDGDSYEVIV